MDSSKIEKLAMVLRSELHKIRYFWNIWKKNGWICSPRDDQYGHRWGDFMVIGEGVSSGGKLVPCSFAHTDGHSWFFLSVNYDQEEERSFSVVNPMVRPWDNEAEPTIFFISVYFGKTVVKIYYDEIKSEAPTLHVSTYDLGLEELKKEIDLVIGQSESQITLQHRFLEKPFQPGVDDELWINRICSESQLISIGDLRTITSFLERVHIGSGSYRFCERGSAEMDIYN